MNTIHYLQIAVLAVIQGAAELLPVSSSAHVILAQRVMGMDPSRPEQVFLLVMLHTGTMFAVLVYFWSRWRRIWEDRTERRGQLLASGQYLPMAPTVPRNEFLKGVIVATIATGVVALGLKFLIENVILVHLLKYPKGEVEELFKHLPLIAAGLVAAGIVILIAGARESANEAPSTGDGKDAGTAPSDAASSDLSRSSVVKIGAAQGAGCMKVWAALLIGLVQGLCVPFRGFSRSGATISTGLFCGVSRSLSEDFSFALAIVLTPPVQVYSVYKLLKAHELSSHLLVETLVPGLAGMVLSFAAGLLALRLLSAVLERGRWKFFGFYCLAASVVIFAANFLLPAA
jgi:undecaprenyl-diphosphatase